MASRRQKALDLLNVWIDENIEDFQLWDENEIYQMVKEEIPALTQYEYMLAHAQATRNTEWERALKNARKSGMFSGK